MHFSMTGLINTINQLVSHESEFVEPTERKMGSLQDHLMAVRREQNDFAPPVSEAVHPVDELSVGPPPLYRKDRASNVVGMPKKKGSRFIFWTQVASIDRAA
ncbi:MAG TPA: hypothetical protein V6C89_05595 [Drouetiella sp.]|jgi:hypothetical protein